MPGRIRERCHPSHRFFTPCHIAASLLSHTAFLPLFRMTIEGESVIMQEMLIVILNECEGSIPVVRKAVRCHQGNILHSVPLFRFLFFSQRILTSLQNDRSQEGLPASGVRY